MKVAGILSIITSPFVFFSSAILMGIPYPSPEISIVLAAEFIGSIYLLANGIAMIRAADKIRSLERKVIYLSGATRTGYDRDE